MTLRFLISFSVLIVKNAIALSVFSQEINFGDSVPSEKFYNWHNLDRKLNKIQGISTEKAYEELLKDKPMTRVVVAVIDGGIDIHHEDLCNKIWVNEDEVPGNGIDDDKNGYTDDVHGWNFIGGPEGRNINEETAEITRLYKKYKEKIKHLDTTATSGFDLDIFATFRKMREKYYEKLGKAQADYDAVHVFEIAFRFSDSVVISILNKTDYTLEDIKNIKVNGNDQLKLVTSFLKEILKKGFKKDQYLKAKEYIATEINYHYNLDFDPRHIVGDNPEIWSDSVYGNNDVTGSRAEHGTFVAGIIGARRDNNSGIKGIADSVKIMSLRTVPDGDERDKDVANAIIYAVNNGAQILNLSFGKNFSPQKSFVDSALRFAQSKDVLIVHAAGNDAENIDIIPNYPNRYFDSGETNMKNWIEVGASSQKTNKELPARFSNYGQRNVDLFAPGANICSTVPGNKYSVLDGTSFAAPMVTGIAAILKSVYPSLTSGQLREILMKSCIQYPKSKVYLPNKMDEKKSIVNFGSLSVTGGIVNLYSALQLAAQYAERQVSNKLL